MTATPSDDLREQLRRFIAENFYVPEPSKLGDDTSLIERGIVDSTGILEVLAFIEREFQIRVEDAEVVPANLDSIQNIAAFVDRKRQPPSRAA